MVGVNKKLLVFGVGLILIVAVIIAVLIIFVLQKAESDHEPTTGSVLGRYKQAAVSTNGQECAQIGSTMLARDGSAVDAAIAALLCEGVASLHSMGLGGGFLMTIWDAETKTANFLDAREVAPSKAHQDMYEGRSDLAMYGGLSVAVPGELQGYWEAHRKYGKLPWRELFEPAINLCKVGSIVNDYLAAYLARFEPKIKNESTLAEILVNPATNSTWKAGDRIKRPQLAKTLAEIAREGPNIFYHGTMGDDLIREIKGFNGIMEKKDLENYRVKWRKPIMARIQDYVIYSAPPPGSGVILTFIMNVLYTLLPVTNTNIMWQRVVETFKWAYAGRTKLGDPDFVGDAIEPIMQNLTSRVYVNEVRVKIRDNETQNDPRYYGAFSEPPTDAGTAHVSVIAPDGSAVSVTSTINQVLGAMIRSKSTGIIFNDEMDDFSLPDANNGFDLPPSPSNFIRPGKRPLSSMSPTIVLNGNDEVRLVIGAAGGSKITSAVAVGMILNLWYDYDIKESIDTLRIHHQLLPMTVQSEVGFDEGVIGYLKGVGHKVTTFSGIGSAITAVAKNKGEVTANSDYRRQGRTAGF